jgi:hypothetical protein
MKQYIFSLTIVLITTTLLSIDTVAKGPFPTKEENMENYIMGQMYPYLEREIIKYKKEHNVQLYFNLSSAKLTDLNYVFGDYIFVIVMDTCSDKKCKRRFGKGKILVKSRPNDEPEVTNIKISPRLLN